MVGVKIIHINCLCYYKKLFCYKIVFCFSGKKIELAYLLELLLSSYRCTEVFASLSFQFKEVQHILHLLAVKNRRVKMLKCVKRVADPFLNLQCSL